MSTWRLVGCASRPRSRRGAVAHAEARVAAEARVYGTDDGWLEGCCDSCPFRDRCISTHCTPCTTPLRPIVDSRAPC
jgi:hypothetical protein